MNSLKGLGVYASAFLLVVLLNFGSASANRRSIETPIILPGTHVVLSEHGVPNGAPCDWYAYATAVGLEYCDHPGMDIEVSYVPIYAVTDGVVEFSGSDGYYTPYHIDIKTAADDKFGSEIHVYGHLSEIYVTAGETVTCGQVIGVTGSAGGWPHLHFERRTLPTQTWGAGIAIDPEPVLERPAC